MRPLSTGSSRFSGREPQHAYQRYGQVLQHRQGFGFIQPEHGDRDVFVHARALEAAGISSLYEGDKVSFVLEDDPKRRGKQAGQLQKA